MSDIGIYPGAFDPVHRGHIAFARAAAQEVGLDRVVFLPEAYPRRKTGVTHIEHRIELLRRVLAGDANIGVDTAHGDRFSTEETLPKLQDKYPGRLWFLLGSDVAKRLGRWDNIDVLCRSVGFIVGLRQSDTREDLQPALADVYMYSPRIVFVESPERFVSSSLIRSGDEHIDLGSDVASYIREHNLYREG